MRELDRDRSMGSVAHRVKPSGRLWNPSADVYRSSDGWIVKWIWRVFVQTILRFEINGNRLHVRGCRKDTFYREGFIYHQMEITYSQFEKTIEFPAPLEGASLVRDYRDGFLIIILKSD